MLILSAASMACPRALTAVPSGNRSLYASCTESTRDWRTRSIGNIIVSVAPGLLFSKSFSVDSSSLNLAFISASARCVENVSPRSWPNVIAVKGVSVASSGLDSSRLASRAWANLPTALTRPATPVAASYSLEISMVPASMTSSRMSLARS